MILPETFIIYGANSSIGSEFAKKIQPKVKRMVLFYHNKTDLISGLLKKKNVSAIQSEIKDFNDYKKKILEVKLNNCINDLGAVYFSTKRSEDHKPLHETELDQTKDIIDTNILGAIHFLKGILSINKTIDSTRIVLIGSNVSRIGLQNGSVYAATKAAIANLTRSVAMEEGVYNTFINTISPGPVEMKNNNFTDSYVKFRQDYFEAQKKTTSLKKLATVDDVCQIILFLTSLENKHITGEEVFCAGGSL